MAKPPSDQAEKIVVRLPEGMRSKLAEVAKANNRSVNAEVVAALADWLSSNRDGLRLKADTSNILEAAEILMKKNPGIQISVTFTAAGESIGLEKLDLRG